MWRWGLNRLMYSPFLVQLVVIRRCNLSCGYCNEFDETSEPVPYDELIKRIDKIYELGAWSLEFTGGEPLEHPRLVDLVRYARDKGFYQLELISNGYLWNEAMVHALNDAGLDKLQISVDGVTPNDVTVKVLKPLRKKLETIAKHAKFKVTLSGVIGSAPPGEALQVVEFAKQHNLRPRVLLVHDGDGQIRLTPEQAAEYAQVKEAIGERFNEADDYRSKLMRDGKAPFKCRSGSRYLYVDEFGVVRWCSQTRDRWGMPLAEYSLAELKRQFSTKKDCNAGCTVGCVRSSSAPDRWRAQSIPEPPPMTGSLVQIKPRQAIAQDNPTP
jgi:MoaA/NifB/PqqE/SkfB family radical SAM enzyme